MIVAMIIAALIAAQHANRQGSIPAIVIPADEQALIRWIESADGSMELLGE